MLMSGLYRMAVVEDQDNDFFALEKCLSRFGKEHEVNLEIRRFVSAEALLESYRWNHDMVFFDIQLGGMDGMEAARRIREKDPECLIIFVTNMVQYAVKGYEVDALDFIVKPVRYYDFAMKMTKAFRLLSRKKQNYTLITTNLEKKKLPIDSIYYIDVNDHNLNYHTDSGTYIVRGSLSKVEEELSGCGFARCSISCIVNLKYVTGVTNEGAIIGKNTIYFSRGKRKGFIAELTAYLGGSR